MKNSYKKIVKDTSNILSHPTYERTYVLYFNYTQYCVPKA